MSNWIDEKPCCNCARHATERCTFHRCRAWRKWYKAEVRQAKPPHVWVVEWEGKQKQAFLTKIEAEQFRSNNYCNARLSSVAKYVRAE